MLFFFVSSGRRHTRCALVTGVQTCALPILKVAMPQRRGRALPTNAIRSAGVCRPSQCLPFGLAVIFTADASWAARAVSALGFAALGLRIRSEEHTSELQSLMRISYAVFCLKKKKKTVDKI